MGAVMITATARFPRTAGLAFAGASLIAISSTPFNVPLAHQPGLSTAHVDVSLSAIDAADLLNIPVNLFNDFANIPYYLFNAPYSVFGLVPQFAAPGQDVEPGFNYPALPTSSNVSADPLSADGVSNGALNNLANALFYTGSWWKSSPTNVWGWDTANPWNFAALLHVLLPMQPLSEPLANNLNTLLAAEFPIAEPANKFLFYDLPAELNSLFKIPTSQLEDGSFTFGDGVPATNPPVINPVGVGNDPLGNGGTTYPEIWNGTTPHLDPSYGLGTGTTTGWGSTVTNFFQSLLADPSQNPIHQVDLKDVVSTFWNVYNSFNTDFSPFYMGADPATGVLIPGTDSFVFQGAQVVYGIPALINGIFGTPVIPDSVTQEVGAFLNQIVGPDSAFATSTVATSNAILEFISQLELATGGPGVPGFVDAAGDALDTLSTAGSDAAAGIATAADPSSLFDLPL